MSLSTVAITPGSGVLVGVDTISGTSYQVMKLGIGAADSLSLVPNQTTASNNVTYPSIAIPTAAVLFLDNGTTVDKARGDTTNGLFVNVKTSVLPTGASTEASLASAVTSLQIMDDWDESDRAKVNPIVGQAGITAGAGSVAANTPRVTHASDDPVTTAVQIMDDWDESDRAKVNLIVGQAGVAAGAGSVSALTQRMTLASDDPLNAKFPTAAALTDADANPTTTKVGAHLMIFDGSTWDRARSITGIGASDLGKSLAVAMPTIAYAHTISNINPTGTDITDVGSAFTSGDFDIRDTSDHYVRIPMSGFRNVTARYYVNPAFDRDLTFLAYVGDLGGNNDMAIFQITLPSGTTAQFMVTSVSGGIGPAAGMVAGGTSIVHGSTYMFPLLAMPSQYVTIRALAGSAPSAGRLAFTITRQR